MPDLVQLTYDVVITRKSEETKTFTVQAIDEERAGGVAVQHAKAAAWADTFEFVVDSCTDVTPVEPPPVEEVPPPTP